MATSLYDLTVASYLQGLGSMIAVLDKGADHAASAGVDLDAIVARTLIDDMAPFHFQIVSVAHHSRGAMRGLEAGEFGPPNGYGEMDYAGLKQLLVDCKTELEGLDRATVDGWSGGKVVFKLGGNELPFTTENFVLSFSLPNFYFHAATAYDLLRMGGTPLGKRDFLGALRMGA